MPRAGASTWVLREVELGLLERRARRCDLRVVVAGFAGRLQRLAQLGLGSANLAARFLARGLRDLEAAHRDRAGILLYSRSWRLGVALGHVAIGLGRLQRGARGLDAGVGALRRSCAPSRRSARALCSAIS